MPGPRLTFKTWIQTSEMYEQMAGAEGRARQFGRNMSEGMSGGVTGLQSVRAELRLLQGGMTGNLRAAENFINSFSGISKLAQAAFPLAGGLAFLGLLTTMSDKLYKFYVLLRDGQEHVRGAFADLNASLHLSNAQLDLSNDKLENELAKLQGRHENALKEMLDETRVSADNLGISLSNTLDKLNEVLTKNATGIPEQLIGRISDKGLREELFGHTGKGGFYGDVRSDTNTGIAAIDAAAAAKDEKGAQAARASLNAKLQAAYQQMIRQVSSELETLQNKQLIRQANGGDSWITGGDVFGKVIEEHKDALQSLQESLASIPKLSKAADLQAAVDKAGAANVNQKEDSPFTKKLQDLQAQLAASSAKLSYAGGDETAKRLGKAMADTAMAIDQVNKGLDRLHEKDKLPTDPYASQVGRNMLAMAQQTEANEAEAERLNKAQDVANKIRDQVEQQRLLNAAIDGGWEAQRRLNVEVQLMKDFGHDAYNDPDNQAEVEKARVNALVLVDAKRNEELAKTISQLSRQTDIERILAGVQSQGAYAIEKATLQEEIRQKLKAGEIDDATAQAMMEKFYESSLNNTQKDIASIQQKIEANKRLAAAVTEGAAAVRAADLANELAEARRKFPNQPLVDDAIIRQAASRYGLEVQQAGSAADRVQKINDELDKLKAVQATADDRLAIEEKINDLENERIQALVEESLGMRGARDGMRAFFLEMQEQAESTAKIIYTALNSALDRTNENLAKIMMGEKAGKGGWAQQWGKEFQGIGEQVSSSALKSLEQRGLGALGKLFHVDIGKAPDGTEHNPLWVRMAGGGGYGFGGIRYGTPGAGAAASPGTLGGLPTWGAGGIGTPGFGAPWNNPSWAAPNASIDPALGGGFTGNILKLFGLGGGRAGGGAVEPGTVYPVGEEGPEFFAPSTSGRIIPSPGGMGGGTTIVQDNSIHAQGADFGVYNRLARLSEARSQKATAEAVQAMHERGKRTPRG